MKIIQVDGMTLFNQLRSSKSSLPALILAAEGIVTMIARSDIDVHSAAFRS